MVPPMAPQSNALFPICFPATTSATAAPKTICVSESNLRLGPFPFQKPVYIVVQAFEYRYNNRQIVNISHSGNKIRNKIKGQHKVQQAQHKQNQGTVRNPFICIVEMGFYHSV